MRTLNTKKISMAAVFMSLTIVATLLAFPIAFGYINLGDGIILTAGLIMGPFYGMVIGGVGAGLADILLGYPQYAVATLIIKGCMGAIAGIPKKNKKQTVMHFILGGVVLVGGYFVTDVILYGNPSATLATIPLNTLQYSVGVVMCALLAPIVKKIKF